MILHLLFLMKWNIVFPGCDDTCRQEYEITLQEEAFRIHVKNIFYVYDTIYYEYNEKVFNVFFKDVVFHNVGLSCLIQSKAQVKFYFRSIILIGFKMDIGIIQLFFTFAHLFIWRVLLQLNNNTGMIFCVPSNLTKNCMQRALIIWVVEVSDHLHMGLKLMCWSIFVTLPTSSTYGYTFFIKLRLEL